MERRSIIKSAIASALSPFAIRSETGAARSDFIAEAKRSGRPYLLDAVTMSVRMADVASRSGIERHRHVRAVYTLYALRDLKAAEPVFVESYSSSAGAVKAWHGTMDEHRNADGSYSIGVDLPEGELATFVTGAEMQLSLDRTGHVVGGANSAEPGHDRWFYPIKDDFVYECVVILESENNRISAPSEGAMRTFRTERAPVTSTPRVSDAPSNGGTVVSASWRLLRPGEEVSIQYESRPDNGKGVSTSAR